MKVVKQNDIVTRELSFCSLYVKTKLYQGNVLADFVFLLCFIRNYSS